MNKLTFLFILGLTLLLPCQSQYRPNIERLRMDQRQTFLNAFVKTFFFGLDQTTIEEIKTCIPDFEDIGYNAAQGIFKYQLGYTYAEKIIALSFIGKEFTNLVTPLQNCASQFPTEIEQLQNSASHFMHPNSVDRHGHSLMIADRDVTEKFTSMFHQYNVRQYTQMAETLASMAREFRDARGQTVDLDQHDINLFTILDSITSSFTSNKGDPKIVFLYIAGKGEHFFQVLNDSIPNSNVEALSKTQIVELKHRLTDEFKDIFQHIKTQIEGVTEVTDLDRLWVNALVDCYNDDSNRNDHVIEGIMKNSLNYMVKGDYVMGARFLMGTFIGPCRRPDEFSFRMTQ